MCQDEIMEKFWKLQDSEHAKFVRKQALHKIPECSWIIP